MNNNQNIPLIPIILKNALESTTSGYNSIAFFRIIRCFLYGAILGTTAFAEPIPKIEPIPIVVDAVDHLNYSSPISGFIERILYQEGSVFKKNEVLVEYNCTTMHAEKEKAAAAVDFLKEKAQNMHRLYKLGGASNNEQAEARSQLKAAEEELTIKSYTVSRCNIKAPFDGQVVKLFASPFEYIEQGRPLLEVINLNHLQVKLILPSEWLTRIKEGTTFQIHLNETQKTYTAKITRMVYSIDAVSNTFVAFARLVHNPSDIKPGMSGIAEFGATP